MLRAAEARRQKRVGIGRERFQSPRLTGGGPGSRPSTSGGLPTPGKLLRSLSGTLSNQEEPVANDKDPLSQVRDCFAHCGMSTDRLPAPVSPRATNVVWCEYTLRGSIRRQCNFQIKHDVEFGGSGKEVGSWKHRATLNCCADFGETGRVPHSSDDC